MTQKDIEQKLKERYKLLNGALTPEELSVVHKVVELEIELERYNWKNK